MPTAVISSPRWRYLQDYALVHGGTPTDALNALIDQAMSPPVMAPLGTLEGRSALVPPDQTVDKVLATIPDEVSRKKREAAERMAHARSFRRSEQHG